MNETDEPAARLVLENTRDEDGLVYREISLTGDGRLAISGQDLGSGVQDFWGCDEYEFERRLSLEETATLRRLVELPADGDLLAVLAERFGSSTAIESFLDTHELAGTFWSRVGD